MSHNIAVLAYELFLQNKTSRSSPNVKRVKPLKKVYYQEKGKNVRLDYKTPEEYGSRISYKAQNILSMPLNTSPYLSLPNKVTGSNQPRPYIEFYGKMESKRSGDIVFSITRSGKNNKGKKITFDATYIAITEQRTITNTSPKKEQDDDSDAGAAIFFSIDKNHYFIEDRNLFQAYVDSGALTANGFLTEDSFKIICNLFFDYIEERWTNDMNEKIMDFS